MTDYNAKKRRIRRNRYKMRLDLMEAVREVLRDKGFINLNINNVTQYADVDRNAIYRHFGNFDNLLSQYIESKDYWLETLEKIKDVEVTDYKRFLKQVVFEVYEKINRNVELQQLIIWELSEFSLRTKAISEKREMLSKNLVLQYEKYFENTGIDINMILAILYAGIFYLLVHKKHATFCQVDFVKEKERVLDGIDKWIEIIFQNQQLESKQRQIAIRALQKGIDKQLVAEITGLPFEAVQKLAKDKPL